MLLCCVFFFKQKTAYEMRISDWSSDVCSSDLIDGVSVNGLDIGELTSRMDARDMAEFAQGIDLTLLLSSTWPFIVLALGVFFYCLGALYDECKDRSVLFWKSLPVSDADRKSTRLNSSH